MTIKDIRSSMGMNMKEFAEYLEIPYRTLQNWENEVRKCPPYLLKLIEYYCKNNQKKP